MGLPAEMLKMKPLNPDFQPPKQATEGSAGFDVYMPEGGTIPAGGQIKVGLGFATAIPKGYVGLIVPRSGVGTRETLELANSLGVIDSDFRGELTATLRTKSGQPFSWEPGARLLQFLVVPVARMMLALVDDLDETVRGEGGHGSTGK